MPCTDCKYIGWKGLERYCRHPAHVKPLKNTASQCNDWLSDETKHMPDEVPKWPYPVKLAEKNA